MSRKMRNALRAATELATEAHHAVHLLLDLSEAITEPCPAAECRAQAESLGHALRRVIPLIGTEGGAPQLATTRNDEIGWNERNTGISE